MARYKCIMEYDGENYAGFQIQPNALTVQECTEKALSDLFGVATKITASGRTDSGVSARGQVIHFDSDTEIAEDKIPFALKSFLPNDIAVISCVKVNDEFHARFSAKAKNYSYQICITKINRPLYKKHYQYPYNIDLDLLNAALLKIKGKHNFKAFMSSGSDISNFEREIYDIELIKTANDCFTIKITANGFLYNMVRIIVGTALDIARGKIDIANLDKMFESGDRNLGGHTAPPEPLTLEEVFY